MRFYRGRGWKLDYYRHNHGATRSRQEQRVNTQPQQNESHAKSGGQFEMPTIPTIILLVIGTLLLVSFIVSCIVFDNKLDDYAFDTHTCLICIRIFGGAFCGWIVLFPIIQIIRAVIPEKKMRRKKRKNENSHA